MPKLLPHIGVPARNRRVLPALATIAISLVAVGLHAPVFTHSSSLECQKSMLSQASGQAAPVVLSQNDAEHYRLAFAFQRAGHIEQADAAAALAHDPLLKGVLLGERYLANGYQPNFSEIALWLARYGDHAQARDLYHLAQERTPGDADFLTEPRTTGMLKGFSNGHDRSALAGKTHWVAGLAAFRRHDMHVAATHFKALLAADADTLSSDDRASAAFWAYRTSLAAGDKAAASQYLGMAASAPPGFYSILARQVSGDGMLRVKDVQGADIASFLRKASARRAMALKAIGEDALAEKELRAIFPGSNAEDRAHLVQLARILNLPAAQMRMAVAGAYDTGAADALYPLPHWAPTSGYRVEPALLFAIMRQESGFNPNAKSASGAMGVMQLMPATASAMARDARLKLSPEPAVSMTLGQRYLERLMELSAINDNLIFLIGAYNAGPGTMAGWRKSVDVHDDPLLFIESIPCVQTRDYIVRVMGNYWVYSGMLGGYDNASVAALAQNRWPRYERAPKQMLALASRLNTDRAE